MTPLGGIPTEFVLFALRLQESELETKGVGSTFTAINKTDLEQIEVPLPPLAEQKRIVAKIEELLARVVATRERLAKVPAIVKRFRQAVLAAACEGRLTEDWRAAHHQDGVGDEGLPEGWRQVNVGSLLESLKYGTAAKCEYNQKGIAVLRIPNVSEGRIVTRDLKFAELSAKEIAALSLAVGDILMIRSNGSVSLVGKTALVEEGQQGLAYAGYLIRLRPNKEAVNSRFLNLALSSFKVRLKIELEARSTSGVNNINSEEVRGFEILLPPLVEQAEIVHRVKDLFTLADQIEVRHTKAKIQVDRLTQSILAKAFRGELVPQDPSDEPAESLLARIHATKVELASSKINKPSRPKIALPKAPREKSKMAKNRNDQDVRNKGYLAAFLRSQEGSMPIEKLFQVAELPLTDFYKQLAWEIDHGHVKDDPKSLKAL